MSAATFDTLTAARELEAAGIERRQAEAIAEGMRRAAGADRGELVTRGEFYRALWIQAAALIGAQIAIAGFIVHLLSQPWAPRPARLRSLSSRYHRRPPP